MNLQPRIFPKIIVAFAVLLVFSITIPMIVHAQPGLPKPPSQKTPVGGMAVLAAAGGAYAIKKLWDKNKD
jgi:hypothetical protein